MYLMHRASNLLIKYFWRSLLNTSATSPLVHSKGETGALRSSVFEINKSSSIVNFITHVWSCCSDLLFADWAFGPEGRQLILKNQADFFQYSWILVTSTRFCLKTKHVSVIDVDPCIEVRC